MTRAMRQGRSRWRGTSSAAPWFWGTPRVPPSRTRAHRRLRRAPARACRVVCSRAHPGAKAALTEIWNAEDRGHALRAAKAFADAYGPNGPRRQRRSPSTSTCCSPSTTTPPSTGSTCARPTRSSPPSRPCGCGSGSSRGPARGLPGGQVTATSQHRGLALTVLVGVLPAMSGNRPVAR